MDWDLDKGEILKTYKNEFECLKTIFFMKKGIRNHFCKVSSAFKPFWQVTIFHTRLPHKPNHGLGLRQGWNSENLQKWVWMPQNDIFHEERHTQSFLQSFKCFQAILTSYHISHQTSPQTKSWIGTFPTNQIMDWDLDKGEILKTYKNEFECLKTIFFMKKGIRNHFCKVSSAFKPFWHLVTIFFTPDFSITNQSFKAFKAF